MAKIVECAKATGDFSGEAGSKDLLFRSIFRAVDENGMSVNYNDVLPGGNSKNHSHPEEHVTYVVAGSGVLDIGGTLHPIHQGCAVYIAPNEPHCFRNTGTETMVLFGVRGPTYPGRQ